MIFGNIKVLGEVDNMEVYPKLFVKDKIAFPLLSMPIETQPKVRILQQWFSEQILPWNLAKQFIRQEKSVLDLIAISGGKETRKEVINNARVTDTWLGWEMGGIWNGNWPLKHEIHLEDKKVLSFNNEGWYVYLATNNRFKSIEIEIKDAPTIVNLSRKVDNKSNLLLNFIK
ncbi:hypothetical protein [Spiroplasma ixodetis]|nr:hypothetical protein [Spiroplasma ixodetis]